MRAWVLSESLPDRLKRCVELASEKGASTWMEALPVREYGFHLSGTEFRDSLSLRYGWRPAKLPSTCVCGQAFDTTHALSCPTGGLPSIRHNEIRDLLATTLTEVCSDVATEPQISVNTATNSLPEECKRLDIRARGFWGGQLEAAFFDVRVFNPFAASAITIPVPQLYRRHEQEKRRKYEQRLQEENYSFTPLVFSTSGGASKLTTRFLQHLASKLSDKKFGKYAQALCWLRTRLAFTIARAGSMCLRACRSRRAHPSMAVDPVSALSAAKLI